MTTWTRFLTINTLASMAWYSCTKVGLAVEFRFSQGDRERLMRQDAYCW